MGMPTSTVEGGTTLAATTLDAAELLTPREREVFSLLSEGMTAVAIARRLRISPRTVEKHLENGYAKVGVRDRLSAVLLLYLTSGRTSM